LRFYFSGVVDEEKGGCSGGGIGSMRREGIYKQSSKDNLAGLAKC
jgi:hypothetical protein